MWPTWPNGCLESSSQISPMWFDLTGPAMESGFTSAPRNQAGWESIVVPPPVEVDGISPLESFEGKTLYFAIHEEKSMLKIVALPGQPGTESEVEGLPRLSSSSLWTLSPGGIYVVPADAPRSLRYFDFASKQIRPTFEADKDFSSGLSVSPDGHCKGKAKWRSRGLRKCIRPLIRDPWTEWGSLSLDPEDCGSSAMH